MTGRKFWIFWGTLILGVLLASALFGPFLVPDPARPDLFARLLAPSFSHPFGTDELGRDVLSRLLAGGRVSLAVAVSVVLLAGGLGIIIGSISGYWGGRLDSVLMRTVDVMNCIPTYFLILSLVVTLGPSLFNVVLILGLTSWTGMARLVRAEILSLRERDFVLAARASGLPAWRIIARHILPNLSTTILVASALLAGDAILIESGLSFLGLGVQPPTASWGNLLTSGHEYLQMAWWLIFFPGFAIFLAVASFNLLAEGLRDILDPRIRAGA